MGFDFDVGFGHKTQRMLKSENFEAVNGIHFQKQKKMTET